MTEISYESMMLTELKQLAKDLGIKNISKLKKSELIEAIIEAKKAESAPVAIEKDGVVLREKISPKSSPKQEGVVEQPKKEPVEENNSPNINTNNVNTNNFNNNTNNNANNNVALRNENGFRNQGNGYYNQVSEEEKKERLRAVINEAETVEGILDIVNENPGNNFGFLRCKNYVSGNEDVYVSPSQIKRFNLKTGDEIKGKARCPKDNSIEKYRALVFVEGVNGYSVSQYSRRQNFEKLVPIYPDKRIKLETADSSDLSSRLMDIICPIGFGQRGIIVAPPKAGKTTLLKKIAQNISKNYPNVKLMVLLIDERPEEVTDMQRSINGEVIYSTFDEEPQNHTKIAQLVLERAKRLVEHGHDVVILLDSLTRLTRAWNLTINPTGRTLSGGLDPGALIMPKKFFGAARNIEEGGSLTILATALVETGSRMDDMIFEEFKGTGNMEVHLDRRLQERRIFPAIDIYKSGTRKEDLLLNNEEKEVAYSIRKVMYRDGNVEGVTENLINYLQKTKNNEEFVNMFQKLESENRR